MQYKTIIEPFRIKSVEPIGITTEEDRAEYLRNAHYNPFLLDASRVMIDLLTDSGTSAMSSRQWAAMMEGDESYAGASSWHKFENAVRDLTGFHHIFPTHQGRAAERILYGTIGGKGKYFLSNTHFDTTRANIEYSGAEAIDLPYDGPEKNTDTFFFKGNIDIPSLEKTIAEKGAENIAAVILTVTNNSGGGQPVSMENARQVSAICRKHAILLVIDCCRIAENAWFIKQHERGFAKHSCFNIAREMFDLADVAVMSAKKDGLANMGGFLAMQDNALAGRCRNLLIITEGFTTYGGLSGRDMEAIAVGLREVFDENYLHYRIRSTAWLGEHLHDMGVPVLMPAGGHAVYIDARAFYPQIPVEEYPGQMLVCRLYLAGGIRSAEIGSVMFGKYDAQGKLIPAARDLVRLAIPRRVYTQSHIEYVVEVFSGLMQRRDFSHGLRITWEPPFLRHFTACFEPV